MNRIFVQGSIIALSLSLMLSSCTDDKLNVGLGVLPESEQFDIKADTLPIECYTVKGVPNYINNTSKLSGNSRVGSVFDPKFGEIAADIILEFNWSKSSEEIIEFADKPLSLKLYLNTTGSGSYGKENSIDFEVYRLGSRYTYNGATNQEVPSDFYAEDFPRSTGQEYDIQVDVSVTPLDTAATYTVIELDDALALSLLDPGLLNSNNALLSSVFYDKLAGLILRGNKKTGTIGELHTFDPRTSKLILEFERTLEEEKKDDEGNVVDTVEVIDTLYFGYDISRYQSTYRHIHKNVGAEVGPVYRDTITQHDKFYLQSLGGTMGYIKLDALIDFKQLNANKVGVNLAELVFPVNPLELDEETYSLAPRLIAHRYEDGISLFDITDSRYISLINGSYLLPDAGINYAIRIDENNTYFNGTIDKEKSEYRINVTEYVNWILLGRLNYYDLGLTIASEISATSNELRNRTLDYKSPSRVVLNSGLEQNIDRAFLRIVYTNLQ